MHSGSRLKSLIVWGSLVLFTLMIMLPPIIYKYIYPNGGEDFSYHLAMIKINDLLNQMYFGYVLAYPLKWLSPVFNVSVSFMWFYFISVLGVGYSIYFVLSRLVNWIAGVIGIVFCLIMSVGIWLPFSYGEIYNVINIGIFFPFVLYFGIKWLKERKIWQLIGFYCLEICFGLCHPSGIYLIPLIGIGGLTYGIVQKIKREKIDRSYLFNGIIALLISIGCTLWLYLKVKREWSDVLSGTWRMPITIAYQFKTVSPLILVGIVMVILASIYSRKLRELYGKSVLLFSLLSLDITLYACGLGLSPQNGRQYYDFTVVWGLTGAVILGIYIEKNWNNGVNSVMALLLVTLVIWGVVSNYQMWTRYDSAVTDADKEAIAYVNSLSGKTYITNSNVSLFIYNTFLNKQYSGLSDILITRNLPEAGSCVIGGSTYMPHGINGTDGYTLLKEFKDDRNSGVTVDVYKK